MSKVTSLPAGVTPVIGASKSYDFVIPALDPGLNDGVLTLAFTTTGSGTVKAELYCSTPNVTGVAPDSLSSLLTGKTAGSYMVVGALPLCTGAVIRFTETSAANSVTLTACDVITKP